MNKIIIFLSIILLAACSEGDIPNSDSGDGSYEWLIPRGSVRDGGPGKDGIPSVDDPKFALSQNTSYLDDNELVLVGRANGEVKIYPHQILDWHEIVNDNIGNRVVAIIYCPLTGSGMAWNRVFGDGKTTFGVSGLLYNNNVIPYDRSTGSNWSQIRRDCVNGDLIGQKADVLQLIETTYGTAREIFPSALVMTKETGYTRSYGSYPYFDYRDNGNLIFPVDNLDHSLHAKERILAVMDESYPHVYRFDDFGNGTILIESTFRDKDYIAIGSKDRSFMTAFFRPDNDAQYSAVQNSVNIVMEDDMGNKYDIFGLCLEGPNEGLSLRQPENYIAYWFSIPAIYPDVEIYNFSNR